MTSVIRTNIGSALLSLRKSKTLSMREAAEELKYPNLPIPNTNVAVLYPI